ncbi:MAG TPA: B12-binding domain-containing radical SAM protein [Bacteroidales bacterium]|nr:MAG: hypothetical protein A2X11_02775 [Bacteroidetes bacterium GWE2_42_24]OFY28847.1 MAG: hypothetical protein A2X09_12360 [Bacteroidetes bacterium GWF2_43_11]HAQ65852.1 B12-binding domain-containing radical SAM protein [Bacteroidales bacterium]HBZ67680.1 B12-binding domain-containing radical SAM protein [Bacteroidales bacterium]
MNHDQRRTLLLINPVSQLRTGFLMNRATKCQPLSLGIIAGLTPQEWKVKIIDENFRQFRYYEADLVGITSFTATATRAYELAGIYRAKGIPVVMGGIHATMVPDEAGQYCDSVVMGEAESIWQQVLEDFESGSLKKQYRGTFTDLIHQPLPRRELFHPGYIAASIQTSRGCPMDCSFCSVSAFNGRHYRFRPINEVLDELEQVSNNYVFFVDDNIVGHNTSARERAKELFTGIIERGIKKHWISQASLNFADDEELLKLAARSGCSMIFLGVETEGIEQLAEAGKKLNLHMVKDETYNQVFNRIRKHGIGVIGGFIFGFDHDTPQNLLNRARFIRKSHVDSIQVSVLTPLPGTRLFEELREAGRLTHTNLPADWERYDYYEPVFKLNNMSAETFDHYRSMAWNSIFSWPQMVSRLFRTLLSNRNLKNTSIVWLNLYHYRRIFLLGWKRPYN